MNRDNIVVREKVASLVPLTSLVKALEKMSAVATALKKTKRVLCKLKGRLPSAGLITSNPAYMREQTLDMSESVASGETLGENTLST